jgi:glycosyltransferase involved in cell wall biosynthesis
MRIAVVGPTHPFKGGIAQHTTALAHHLHDAGHDVEIVSWRRQYPKVLYPGQQTVREPELPVFPNISRDLSWNRPDSWWRAGDRLRSVDLVVVAHVTSVQAPPYRVILSRARRGSPRTIVLCHNVLPHEKRRTDAMLIKPLLARADGLLVHSELQAAVARPLTDAPIAVATMPPFMPSSFQPRSPEPGEHRRLLFFGLVRYYKGVDVLLRALVDAPSDVRLRIAGEFWGELDATRSLCDELGITERVEIRDGYLSAEEVPSLFADVDGLVLPYRSATGSQATWTGFEFGVPVIATRAGNLADDIVDGVNGFVAEPGDASSLAATINRLYADGAAVALRENVRPIDPEPLWRRYLAALLDGT